MHWEKQTQERELNDTGERQDNQSTADIKMLQGFMAQQYDMASKATQSLRTELANDAGK